jgi:hypothetical protein
MPNFALLDASQPDIARWPSNRRDPSIGTPSSWTRRARIRRAEAPHNWRVAIMRVRAHNLGTIEAPDQKAAEAEAIQPYEEQRKRLMIWER